MLLCYKDIPSRLLTPLTIETEIEYSIDSEKFPGLEAIETCTEPTLVIASTLDKVDSGIESFLQIAENSHHVKPPGNQIPDVCPGNPPATQQVVNVDNTQLQNKQTLQQIYELSNLQQSDQQPQTVSQPPRQPNLQQELQPTIQGNVQQRFQPPSQQNIQQQFQQPSLRNVQPVFQPPNRQNVLQGFQQASQPRNVPTEFQQPSQQNLQHGCQPPKQPLQQNHQQEVQPALRNHHQEFAQCTVNQKQGPSGNQRAHQEWLQQINGNSNQTRSQNNTEVRQQSACQERNQLPRTENNVQPFQQRNQQNNHQLLFSKELQHSSHYAKPGGLLQQNKQFQFQQLGHCIREVQRQPEFPPQLQPAQPHLPPNQQQLIQPAFQQPDVNRRLSFGHSSPGSAKRPCYGLNNSVSPDNSRTSASSSSSGVSLSCLDPFDDSFRTARNDGTSRNCSNPQNSAIATSVTTGLTPGQNAEWPSILTATPIPPPQVPNTAIPGGFVRPNPSTRAHRNPLTSTSRTHLEVYGVEGGEIRPQPCGYLNGQSRKRPLPKDSPTTENGDFDEYSCPPMPPSITATSSQRRSTVHHYGPNGYIRKPITQPRPPRKKPVRENNVPPPNAHVSQYLVRRPSADHPARKLMSRCNPPLNHHIQSHQPHNAPSLENSRISNQPTNTRATDLKNTNVPVNRCHEQPVPMNSYVTNDPPPMNVHVTNELPQIRSCEANNFPLMPDRVANDLHMNRCVTNDTFFDILHAQWRSPLDISAIPN